ncbi:MAG: penicillin-binding protein 2 [Rickettsiales bacterium]
MNRNGQRANTKIIIRESTARRIIEQSRVRMLCIGLFFVLCFASISFRMIDVAVIKNSRAMTVTIFNVDNENESDQVELRGSKQSLQRGNIVDRNGVLLATSLMTASVYVNTKEFKDANYAARRLAKILSMDKKLLLRRLESGKSFVWIKRNITPKEQQQVNDLGIPGISFQAEEKRVYPYGNMLSHMIGYVGMDNKGLSGIERQFDNRLRATELNNEPFALSVDVRLQSILHEEMSSAFEEFNAVGAAGMILDIKSGEVLSMVSLPDFNPTVLAKNNSAARFNRVTLGSYEMGSTFKSFTMAMGLDYGVTTMKEGYDATNPLKVSTFTIRDDHAQKRFLNVPEIFAYSSNIGTAKMALDVGGKRQKEFLGKIGMLEPVDIEFPEISRTQFPENWKEINIATIAYGHGIAVTPLHLVRGIATLVNGGTLQHLTLLKNGNKNKGKGKVVISQETSKNIRRLLRLVVDHGTGKNSDVAGYRVGGKTGTAEKVTSGGYSQSANLASFVATFPVDDPKYVVLVMIDEPKGNKSTHGYATGGWVSAPAVGRVIARMGPMLGIKPRYDVPEDDAEKFWVNNGKQKPRQPASYISEMMDKRYISEASY